MFNFKMDKTLFTEGKAEVLGVSGTLYYEYNINNIQTV